MLYIHLTGYGRVYKHILLLPRVRHGARERAAPAQRALQRRAGVVARRRLHARRLARAGRARHARQPRHARQRLTHLQARDATFPHRELRDRFSRDE